MAADAAADATEAEARRAKKSDEQAKVEEQYHDLLIERDNQIAELKQKNEELTAEKKDLNKDINELRNEVQVEKDAAKQAEQRQKKAEDDTKNLKALATQQNDDWSATLRDREEKKRMLSSANKKNEQLTKDVSKMVADNKKLNESIDQLKTELAPLSEQNAAMHNQLNAAHNELEEIFKEFPGRDLVGYLELARERLPGARLRHQDSETRLDRQLSSQENLHRPRLVSGQSLQEQMQAAGDNQSIHSASEHGDNNADEDDDDDPTLTALGLGKELTFSDYYEIMSNDAMQIAELKKKNEELRTALSQKSAAQAVNAQPTFGIQISENADIPPVEPAADAATPQPDIAPAEPAANAVTPQPEFSIQMFENANIAPVEPAADAAPPSPKFSVQMFENANIPPVAPVAPAQPKRPKQSLRSRMFEIRTKDGGEIPLESPPFTTKFFEGVETVPIAPTLPTSTVKIREMPWWMKYIVAVLGIIYMFLVVGLLEERHKWLDAGDRNVELGMSTSSTLLEPLFYRLENWLDYDTSMLG